LLLRAGFSGRHGYLLLNPISRASKLLRDFKMFRERLHHGQLAVEALSIARLELEFRHQRRFRHCILPVYLEVPCRGYEGNAVYGLGTSLRWGDDCC
jgi:hypothetical protein